MFRLQQLVRREMDRIAANITEELGKTTADAKGDVLRGLQVVEHACNIPILQMGELLEGVPRTWILTLSDNLWACVLESVLLTFRHDPPFGCSL